jgi:hypothetical protein
LEYREIAEVLVAQRILQFSDFFRDVSLAFETFDRASLISQYNVSILAFSGSSRRPSVNMW